MENKMENTAENTTEKKIIYFDNNATTPIHKEVLEAMMPYFENMYANPSSMYSFAKNVHAQLEKARVQVASLLGAEPIEICFTSCGSESDNLAIRGTLEAYPNKKHIITTRVEHPAVSATFKDLERVGYEVTFIEVDESGKIDLNVLENAIREDTAIVSVMWANNETGVLFDIDAIGEIVKSRGVVFHVDAVQAVGKIPIDMSRSKVDMLSMSGHKIHAPKGVGALYIRKGTMLRALQTGGLQERGRRAGTENVPYIIGLGKACEMAKANLEHEAIHTKKLRDKMENILVSNIKKTKVNGSGSERLPNTLNISFQYIEGESLLLLLDRFNICASTGSACSSGSLEPSAVLRAMGVPFDYAHSSTRFSFSIYNTEEEVDFVAQKTIEAVETLRRISPYTPKDFFDN